MKRVHNFNAGPAALPLPVLEQVRHDLLDYEGKGLSLLEMSHRSATFEAVRDAAEAGVRALLQVPDDYALLFLQGGASLQFSMVPLNLLPPGGTAAYIVNGSWGHKAFKEGCKVGCCVVAASTEADGFRDLPAERVKVPTDAAYLHFTSNETIEGVQWQAEPEAAEPDAAGVPLVVDCSSDIMSRPMDLSRYGLIYAGAQKNIGPAGVTLVIVRRDLVGRAPTEVGTMLNYATHVREHSLYNTPNTFGVYMVGLVCEWLRDLGGLAAMQSINEEKAALLYQTIDGGDFYRGHAAPNCRSRMNVAFRLPNTELEAQFVAESTAAGMIGLKGHRSVGGIRASIYNAVPLESVRALVRFMQEFQQRHG